MSTVLLIDATNHVRTDLSVKKFLQSSERDRVIKNFGTRLELFLSHKGLQPSQVVCCFDSGDSFRKNVDEDYKANRTAAAASVVEGLAQARETCLAVGVDVLEVQGFEADDLLATLCSINLRRGLKVVLSSHDKDLRQLLVDGRVTQMTAWRRTLDSLQLEFMTESRLFENLGLTPSQFLDLQILIGDKTDNIRGAEGWGEVTATKFLQAAGSLENWRKHLFSVGDRLRNSLMRFAAERLEINRALVTLRRDVPLPAAWFEEAAV